MKDQIMRNSDMLLNKVYFWTSTIVSWKHLLRQDKYKWTVIKSLRTLVDRKLISVYGFVVMPNHVHFIWELLAMNKKEMPDNSFSKFTAPASLSVSLRPTIKQS